MGIWQHGKATGELLTGSDLSTPRMNSVPKEGPAISPYLSVKGFASGQAGRLVGDIKGRKKEKLPDTREGGPIESLGASTNLRFGTLTKKACLVSKEPGIPPTYHS